MTHLPSASLPSIAEPDHDPRLFLEEIDGVKALEWVSAQNAKTLKSFADSTFEADRDALAALYDCPDKIAIVSRRGGLLYNYWTDAHNPRGLWRRTTLESYRSKTPQWEILLDLDALAAKEGEDWIWSAPFFLHGSTRHVLICLSKGGADATVLREFDLEKREFVKDGFILPEAKQSAVWLNADTLLVVSALGEDKATDSGYGRTVRRWNRGTAFESAPILFEIPKDHLAVDIQIDNSVSPPRLIYGDWKEFFATIWHFGDETGAKERLSLPPDALVQIHGDHMAFKLRSGWTFNKHYYGEDTLLGCHLAAFRDKRATLTILSKPNDRKTVKSFFAVGKRWYVELLDNLKPKLLCFDPHGHVWTPAEPPKLPEAEVISVWPFDAFEGESNGDLLAAIQGPLTPPSLLLCAQDREAEVLSETPARFNAEGLRVTHHVAISSDGESIPYVQVGPANTNGTAPVLMSGYGGFEVSVEPVYNASVGLTWLQRGGTYVLCHLRGGGEFGTWWHKAGMREGKTLSHDDLAAIADDLVKRGVTKPEHIAAEGGSNGGILITNMMTRYPERFGALFCTIPLIDMRRYHTLLAGASWIAEYGDPNSDDWQFIQRFSAYHHALDKATYPPILIATSQRDDRVHPGHARKMAAKLQEAGLECYFYEPADGGHGYGKTSKERATFTALGYRFLARHVGLADKTAEG